MLVVHSFGGQIEDPVDGFNHRCAYTTFFQCLFYGYIYFAKVIGMKKTRPRIPKLHLIYSCYMVAPL